MMNTSETAAPSEQDQKHTGIRAALNPAVYLVSLLPAAGVVLLARQDIWWAGLVAATLAVVLLQHAINLFNDVSDWRLGADTEKFDSWIRAHQGDLRAATWHGALSAVAGIAIGIITLAIADKLWILLLATPMVLLGYLYNAGRRPLSYTALGEWVTGLCYGPGVFGCLYLLTFDSLDAPGATGMLTFAALAMALLLSHQPPQIETDRAAGKQSFAVRYGRQLTVRVAWGLFLLTICSFSLAAHLAGNPLLPGVFIALAVSILLLSFRKTPNPRLFMMGASGIFGAALLVTFLPLG